LYLHHFQTQTHLLLLSLQYVICVVLIVNAITNSQVYCTKDTPGKEEPFEKITICHRIDT